jgi:DNA-binding NarL/FixJ family response regulator
VKSSRSPLSDIPQGPSRPTIVVADDHQRVLESVSRLLEDDFQVLAAVTDGRQAVDAVSRLDPDAVVLDITMPELDGFRAAEALRRAGSRSRVVFLTLHDAEEFVEAGLATGARGYVLKSRMEADLSSALRHALAGRTFVPSLTSLSTVAGERGGHTIHFRGSNGSSLDDVAEMLRLVTARGEMVGVIGTDSLRAGIEQRLTAAGSDVAGMRADGRYLEWDAAEALSHIMRDGRLDSGKMERMVGAVEESRLAHPVGRQHRMTIFGEMTGLLLQEGNFDSAVRLERLWTDLTRTLPYFTVCSYPVQRLREEEHPDVWAAVCAEHSAVCHAERLQ